MGGPSRREQRARCAWRLVRRTVDPAGQQRTVRRIVKLDRATWRGQRGRGAIHAGRMSRAGDVHRAVPQTATRR